MPGRVSRSPCESPEGAGAGPRALRPVFGDVKKKHSFEYVDLGRRRHEKQSV
jgi:hypothetical protein